MHSLVLVQLPLHHLAAIVDASLPRENSGCHTHMRATKECHFEEDNIAVAVSLILRMFCGV